MVEDNPELVLSIWKKFSPGRKLLGSGENSPPIAIDAENLQEEVYSWKILEPPFDCISNDDARQALHEILVDRLSVSRSPETRRIEVLSEFISIAESVMKKGQAEWISTHSSLMEVNKAGVDVVNPLLALTLHLKWLLDCFADRPGISVSIR